MAAASFPPGMDATIRKQTISTLANLPIDSNVTEKQQVMNVLNGLYGPIKLGQSHHVISVEAFLESPILRKTVEIWWLSMLTNYPIVDFLDVIAKFFVEHLKVHGEDGPKTRSMLHEFWMRTGLNHGQVISLSRTPNGSYSTDSL